MRLSIKIGAITFAASLFVQTSRAETVYYAVSQGSDLGKQVWHAGELKTFNANRPENVFDLYTVQRLNDGRSKVLRELSTPSGDWFLTLSYFFGKDGRLAKIQFDFRTFNGVCSCGETGPVRCQRWYDVDRAGRVRESSERITRLGTEDVVDWTFHEPKVRHWAKLSDLPIKPR